MKLEKLLEQIQRTSPRFEDTTNGGIQTDGSSDCDASQGQSVQIPQNQTHSFLSHSSPAVDPFLFTSMPLFGFMAAVNGNLPQGRPSPSTMASANATNVSNGVVPISPEETSQGLLAVGGCRQCSKTFTDRLELIHHFVDHFPTIFYSFEDRAQIKNTTSPMAVSRRYPAGMTTTFPKINGIDNPVSDNQNPTGEGNHFWGQLAAFLANGNGPIGSIAPSLNNGSVRSFSPPSPEEPFSSPSSAPNAPTLKIPGFRAPVPAKAKTSVPQSLLPHQLSPPITELQKRQNQKTLKESIAAKRVVCQTSNSSESNGIGKSGRKFGPGPKRSLSDLPYHMCPHCCLTFGDSAAYKMHLANHEEELDLDDPIVSAGAQKCVECTFCQMKFASERRLFEHMKVHTIKQCEKCTKTFMTAFDLNLHMGTHSGFTYDCKDCGKCFPCRKSLAEHNKSHRVLRYRSPTPPSPSANINGEEHKLKFLSEGNVEVISHPDFVEHNAVDSLPSEESLEVSPDLEDGHNYGKTKNGDAAVHVPWASSNNSNSNESEPDPELSSEHSSLFGANPFLNKLLRENPRKRHRGSRRQGEKSRRQATLVAREVALELGKTYSLSEEVCKTKNTRIETEQANGLKEEEKEDE